MNKIKQTRLDAQYNSIKSEDDLQIWCAEWIRENHPHTKIFASYDVGTKTNGTARQRTSIDKKRRAMGWEPGTPDLLVMRASEMLVSCEIEGETNCAHIRAHALAIELKAAPGKAIGIRSGQLIPQARKNGKPSEEGERVHRQAAFLSRLYLADYMALFAEGKEQARFILEMHFAPPWRKPAISEKHGFRLEEVFFKSFEPKPYPGKEVEIVIPRIVKI